MRYPIDWHFGDSPGEFERVELLGVRVARAAFVGHQIVRGCPVPLVTADGRLVQMSSTWLNLREDQEADASRLIAEIAVDLSVARGEVVDAVSD